MGKLYMIYVVLVHVMHQCVSLSIRAVAVSSETYDPEFRNVPGIYTLELRGSAKVGNLGTLHLEVEI